MTNEPVAYLQLDIHGKEMVHIEKDMNGYETKPLYTAEQLRPRMKMTQEQHRRFENYKANNDSFYHFWQSVLDDGVSLFKDISEHDLMLAWLDEETIEIVPNMKWFVRSKKTNGSYKYDYLSRMYAGTASPKYGKKDLAIYFDTKEEAEKWKNPLTEVVNLPVEE